MSGPFAAANLTSSPPQRTKIALVGDQCVGKTSLITRFMHGTYDDTYQATIAVDFFLKTVYPDDRPAARLQLWDIPGPERFLPIIRPFVRDVSIVFIVYDITNRASFMSTSKWLDIAKSENRSNTIIVLVGNKADISHNRQVTAEEAIQRATELNIMFMETSAKTEHNIKALFNEIPTNRRLEGARAIVNTARNSIHRVAPITTLPVELLARVFCFVVPGQLCLVQRCNEGRISHIKYPLHPDALSHVCSSWRRVAISTPSLWTHIDIALDHPLNRGLFARAQVYATRAAQLPLEIHISDPSSERERTQGWATEGRARRPDPIYSPTHEWNDLHEFKILSSDTVPIKTLQLDLRIHSRYREIYYSILEYFFARSIPGVLTHYIIRGAGNQWIEHNPFIEPVDTPHSLDGALLGVPSTHLEELWLRTSVVRVSGLCPHWKSKAYHGLVELYIDEGIPEISEMQLVHILKSSPKLQVFHLRAVALIDEHISDTIVEPIYLEDLRDLNIMIHYDEELSVLNVLRWIAPGPQPLHFSYLGSPYGALEDLFSRSNITHFYIAKSGQSPLSTLFNHCSRLEIVALDGFHFDVKDLESLLDIYEDNDEDEDASNLNRSSLKNIAPSTTQIDTLYLLRHREFSFEEIEAVVKRYSVQRLIIYGGKLSYQTDDGRVNSNNLRNTQIKLSSITACPVVEYYPDSSSKSIILGCDDWIATSLLPEY